MSYGCSHTGQRRTRPLRAPFSPLIMTAKLNLGTTRCWSAPAGCKCTNSPLTLRSAIFPSNLSYTLVSLHTFIWSACTSSDTIMCISLWLIFYVLYVFSTSGEEIKLLAIQNSTKITEWSLKVMGKQYEWDLINMTAKSETVNNFEFNQSMIVYTVSIYA